MFQSARLKLTAWYLLIMMVISGIFSAVIYQNLTVELTRLQRLQELRLDNPQLLPRGRIPIIDPALIQETKDRIKFRLLLINLGILSIAGCAGYFLAGRTLRPIEGMVKEQNRFIADASHELRTPLTALKTATEVAIRSKRLTTKEARDLLADNLEEVDRLASLADALLKLTRYQAQNNRHTRTPVAIATVMHAAQKRVHSIAKQKSIKVTSVTTNDTVLGDEQALTDLFVILLDNAVKYSPEKSTVTFQARRSDHTLKISVTDTGIGIEKADLPHIFDRFYRADKARSKKATPGYGLGLSIAQQIVTQHAGKITVSSIPGKGTTFIVSLPVHQ